MTESILTEHRLSGVDLHGLTGTVFQSIQDATMLRASFEERLFAAQEQQRALEAARVELEAQLALNAQDLDATALEIQESERLLEDCEGRLQILKVVEMEMEDTKQRALEELKMSVGKIPPEGASISLRPASGFPSIISSGRPRIAFGRMQKLDPITEEQLAERLKKAISRVSGAPDPGAGGSSMNPDDLQAIREDIRAIIRGRR